LRIMVYCAVRIWFVPVDSLPDPVDVRVVFPNIALQSLPMDMDILPSSRQDCFHRFILLLRIFMHRNTRCGVPQLIWITSLC
jgi:hypothetical protein